ncbi:MAG: MFS transporter [Clostridia bacterium]|nr:MFS transporter [Clostridia bacterium]
MFQLTPTQKKQFLFCCIAFAVTGMMALSIGSLLPFIRDDYELSYDFSGMLLSLHSVGNLFSSFFSGMLAFSIGRRKSMLFFSVFMLFAYLILASFSAPFLLAAAFLSSGLARGASSNFTNVTINEAVPGKAWALNVIHAAFAVGALIMPLLVVFCTHNDPAGWKSICFLMIGLSLLCMLLYANIPLSETTAVRQNKARDLSFLKEKSFVLGTAALFCYLCAEQGVIGWLVTYLQDAGILSASLAQTMASVLWLLILTGRLSVAWLSGRYPRSRLLCFMGGGFAFFFAVLLFGRTLPMVLVGIIGFGLSMAGIYPTVVSCSGDLIKREPFAWSVMLPIASLGSILMPSIIGLVADSFGIFAGMSTVSVAVGVTVLLLVLISRENKKKEAA